MQQQISVITLGITDLTRSRRFYVEGFGWTPVFENEEIIFYQLNGFVLGTFIRTAFEADMGLSGLRTPGAFSLGHNVADPAAVRDVMNRLGQTGGTVIRPPDAPPHGGYRGYIADPDGHAWEIAWNPAWTIDASGLVSFGL